jgi:DNA-binding response OmpR family regulator
MPIDSKANVLLVDDREENLLALQAVLADPEQNLVLAYSGEQAVQELNRQEFAVIVLDVQMPGMDGFQTAELIRTHRSLYEVPIIFLTAIHDNPEHMLRGYSLGAADYIYKPFTTEVLKAKVGFFVELFRHDKQWSARTRTWSGGSRKGPDNWKPPTGNCKAKLSNVRKWKRNSGAVSKN